MDKDLVKEFITEVVERAEDAKGEINNEVSFGRKLAFVEVLSILKGALSTESPDTPREYGLGFGIEKRFLQG